MSQTPLEVELEIECSFKRILYPKNINPNEVDSKQWMLVLYADRDGTQFAACGYNLPCKKSSLYVRLHGSWKPPKDKYDKTFNVVYHEVVFPTTEKGFIEYISSLKVGIGKIRAKSIYARFGESVWRIIEDDPMQLTSVKGITETKVKRLEDKLAETAIERQLTKLFAGTIKVSPKRIKSIKDKLGTKHLVDRITKNPYILCDLNGFSFSDVDRLGTKLEVAANDSRRVGAGAKSILKMMCGSGNVCCPQNELITEVIQLLKGTSRPVDVPDIVQSLKRMCQEKSLYISNGMFYLPKQYMEETGIVTELLRLKNNAVANFSTADISNLIAKYESEYNMSLAPSQREAVLNSLSNSVSVITGGPGTGKSTITRAVLWVFEQLMGSDADIVLMAPTGRAARRMEEATGHPATTIHHMVGFRGDDVEDAQEGYLEGNLFVIDESSMVDQHIGYSLLTKIPDHARIVFVGDPEQLPSVGCGNFLSDLISSGKIATVKLQSVFRQAAGNPIITNAEKIRLGNTELDFTDHRFNLYEESNSDEVFQHACSLYLKSVQKFGVDNVILLNAYRKASNRNPMLNVDTFNEYLQYNYNRPDPDKLSMKNSSHTFTKGDQVMQMKNTELAKNGDVGKIKDIIVEVDPDDPEIKENIALIEFNDDGIINRYTQDMMEELDLAYCTTVHKSQGSQYKTVIMVVSSKHRVLNNRSTLYTGITRASENIAIVTERSNNDNAIKQAIRNTSSAARYTQLSSRLNARL